MRTGPPCECLLPARADDSLRSIPCITGLLRDCFLPDLKTSDYARSKGALSSEVLERLPVSAKLLCMASRFGLPQLYSRCVADLTDPEEVRRLGMNYLGVLGWSLLCACLGRSGGARRDRGC